MKITLIGAGSATFSLNMIKDICLTKNLRGSTVCLMDINEQRLHDAFGLCTRFSKEVGIDLDIYTTTDRKEALSGADYVINTALAAHHGRLKEGWDIARKHGYRFGGSQHVMHDEAFWINFYQLSLMEDILHDFIDICPNAWFILVANPVMAGITYLKRKYPSVKMVGLCHGTGSIWQLADLVGLDKEKLYFEIPGVNHFVWCNRLEVDGKDAFPILDKWFEEHGKEHLDNVWDSHEFGPKAWDLYHKYGVFPIGDTCTTGGGCWGYWYHTDDAVEKSWKEHPEAWYQWYFGWGEDNLARMKKVADDPEASVLEVVPAYMSGEPMIPLIEALECDTKRDIIVNIPNENSLVRGVPADYAVEVTATISKNKITGKKSKDLPAPIRAFMMADMVAMVEMELAAYDSGKYTDLLSLVMMDPQTKSEKQARELIDEILNLEYHKDLKEHYSK